MSQIIKYACDVLVIGGGGAALRAAIAVAEKNSSAKILLLTKGKLGQSGVTANACSDRMAFHVTLPFTKPKGENNWKYHAEDIYRIGGYVSDEDLAEILAKNSKDAFYYLDKLEVPWIRKKGSPHQFLTDGSKFPRACYTGPYTANHIEKALLKRIKELPVQIIENFMAVDLLLSSSKDRVVGVWGVDEKENVALFKAGATVLATGGAGRVFKVNVYPEGMTGDGYAMAYRAGAELVNMEFIQVGLSSVATKLACSGSMMRAIPRFVNDKDEEFLPRYFSQDTLLREIYSTVFQKGSNWPVSAEHTSCLIDIAVYRELMREKSVYLDYSHNPQNLAWGKMEKVINWYRDEKGVDIPRQKEYQESPFIRLKKINYQTVSWLKEKGINLEKGDKLQIAPAAQHFQGGVKIREKGQTSIKGLFAAGECAGGQHGANRPGGGALLDCQVFGKIAGDSALRKAKNINTSPALAPSSYQKIEKTLKNLQNKSKGIKASLARKKVQNILSDHASVVRTKEGLGRAIKKLERIKTEGICLDEKGLIFALETVNLLTVGEIIVRVARIRKESRGPHLYFSHPTDLIPLPRNDLMWQKYTVLRKKRKQDMYCELRDPIKISGGENI